MKTNSQLSHCEMHEDGCVHRQPTAPKLTKEEKSDLTKTRAEQMAKGVGKA